MRLAFLVSVAVLATVLSACGRQDTAETGPAPLTYTGSDTCATCHEGQYELWRDSHHALAMQAATPDSVLGDFNGAVYDHFGEQSTFSERGGNYFVSTTNAEGEIQEFRIDYVFGVAPLQQYLVEFPGGRFQALPVSWDSRPAEEGGQRWFHLYPDTPLSFDDPLHWTGREQNWNYQCAECHSTNLEKNYDAATDTYATTWAEINVGCEGCHGPGSRHVAQANEGEFRGRSGLVVDLDDAGRALWQMNPDTGIATRSELRMRPPVQPEACGRCHARRSIAATDYQYDRPLLDTHTPALLEERVYHADGQILEEVYVYGSFLQSRMYQAGVSCSDCHDPHAARLRTGGEPSNVCATCHLPARFDATEHHRHPDDAVACVDCHMASRNFMVIDGRRDHSFRVPRPDVSLATGAPNACNDCHADRGAEWAADTVTEWYGERMRDHYGYVIHAGRTGGGNVPLMAGIGNQDYPGIVRGTLLTLMRPPYSQQAAGVIRDSLQSGDPLVRLGALRALSGLQPELQVDWAGPLLTDPLRTIRIEAASVVSPLRDRLHVRFEGDFNAAEQELLDSFAAVAERPEARISLGNYFIARGEPAQSEAAFRQALTLDPASAGARVNLADLYRQLGREADAEQTLRSGLERAPEEAAYHHSLGLLLVRTDRAGEGLLALERAATLEPANPRYAYVYAVALGSLGRQEDAVDYLYARRDDFPGDFDIHWALATTLRDLGRAEEARAVATALAGIYPGIPPLENLLRSL